MGGRYALLIASYAYEDEGLRQLTAPAHDAEALAEVLRDPDIAGFEVTTLVNKAHYEIGPAIGDFLRARARDDLTLLYFTGHGLKDDEGHLHLAAVNTRLANRTFTSLPAGQIEQALNACMSRQQVLILDCCYSGAFPAGRLAKGDAEVHTLERFRGHGRTVLTASDAAQYAFEGDELHGSANRSVFTRHLVQGLRDGSADLDGDGEITLAELYDYVYEKVVAEVPQQRPKKQENIAGRTVIAQNTNWRLPAPMENALGSALMTERLAAVGQLAGLHDNGNPTVRARAADRLRLMLDDDSRKVSAAAAAALGESAAYAPPASPRRAEIQSLLDRATEERDAGEVEKAEDRYWTALDLALRERARRQEGWAWDGIGSCRWRAGDLGTAMRFFVRADRIADETGDTLLKAWCLYNFGDERRERGLPSEARDFYEQALAVAVADGHHTPAGWTHHRLAKLARAEQDTDQARTHYEAAAQHGASGGNGTLEGLSLIRLAECAEQAGAFTQARAGYLQAATVGLRLQLRWVAKDAAKGLARIADRPDRVARP